MKKELKIFTVDFESVEPVGNCLVLVAYTQKEAEDIAHKTIKHTNIMEVVEVIVNEPKVIKYLSGDY